MIKNKKVDIKRQGREIVVTDGTKEFYRAEETEQTREIALDIYFAAKYEDDKGEPHGKMD